MIALQTAMAELGLRYHTLRKWMQRFGIKPQVRPYDTDYRLRAITDEDMARLRDARTAQDALGARVVHAPVRRPATSESAPRRVPTVSPRRSVDWLGERAPLPEGWVSYNEWLGTHNVNRRAFERERARGRVLGPQRGEWWERPQGPTLWAFSREQHTAVSVYAAHRWGGRFVWCERCQVDS